MKSGGSWARSYACDSTSPSFSSLMSFDLTLKKLNLNGLSKLPGRRVKRTKVMGVIPYSGKTFRRVKCGKNK
jgi:hypothetical protein